MGNFWGRVCNGTVPEPAPGPVPFVLVPEPPPPLPAELEPIPAPAPRCAVAAPAPKRLPKRPQATVMLKVYKNGSWNVKIMQSTPSFTVSVAEAIVDVIENPDGRFRPSNTLGEIKRFKQYMLQSGWKCVSPDDVAKKCLGQPRLVRFENTQVATTLEQQIGMDRHVYRCLYGVWPPRAEGHGPVVP